MPKTINLHIKNTSMTLERLWPNCDVLVGCILALNLWEIQRSARNVFWSSRHSESFLAANYAQGPLFVFPFLEKSKYLIQNC